MKLPALALFALLAQLPLVGGTLTVNLLGDTNTGTGNSGDLRYVIGLANSGDQIVFSVSGVITLNSELNIGKTLTFIGTGITLNGSNSGNIFNVTGSAVDSFSGFTLEYATGAAITGDHTASVTVTNSTFAGNAVGINGVGVALYDSTVSGGATGIDNTNLTIDNSIVAGNTTDLGSGNVVSLLSSYNNLIGIGGSAGLTNGTNGNQVGVANPLLTSLGNYGGPTATYALLPGSPAINAGNNSYIPSGVTTDQRGPGFDRISGGTVDIGAYEYQTPEPATCASCLLGLAIAAAIARRGRACPARGRLG